MSEIILTLGGIAFRDFEVPEQIIFGGRQTIAIHQTIGGGRVVDALGAADSQVLLSGVFSGPDATARAQALDAARSLGEPISLSWREFSYSVIIEALDMAYTKPWWIPFRLKLEVVRNFTAAAPTTLGQAVLDVAAALGYAAQGGISMTNISATSLSTIATGLSSVNSSLSLTGQSFGQNVAALNETADPKTGAAAIQNIASSAGTLAGLANMHAYLGRAAAALASGV